MRALAWLAVCTLVACSKPSEPAGAGAAGAPDASATAAATGGQVAAPVDAGMETVDAGTAADAGMATGKKPDAGATTASKFTPTKVPEGAAQLCSTIASRYDGIRKSAPLTCKVDADCSCHLVLTQDRVLAVSDRVSAAKLQSMSMAYRKARCPSTPAAASQTCEPKCQAGKCR